MRVLITSGCSAWFIACRRTLCAAQSGRSRCGYTREDLGRRGWRSGRAVRVFSVGLADAVGMICFAAAAERGVELAAIHRGRDHHVGLVDGESFRGGDGGRVRQAHVVGDVVGGQGDARTAAEMLDVEGSAALVDGTDSPAVVVVDPLVGAVCETPVVASGLDVITDADGLGPDVGADADATCPNFPGDDTRTGACLGGELVCGGVIVGEHDRVASGVVRGPPAGETVTVCLRLRTAVDTVVPSERLEAGVVSATELGKGVGFPTVGEAMRFVEFDGAEGVGKRGEHATGHADGTELLMVADEHEFGAAAGSEVEEAIQVPGREHPGLIDGKDVARGELPAGRRLLVLVPVEKLGDGLRRHVGFGAQHVGGGRSVGEADHLVAGVVPGTGSDAQHGGLASAGGTDYDFEPSSLVRDGL